MSGLNRGRPLAAKIAATARGQLNVIPTNRPPNPVTHYFGKKILIFNRGFVLDQFSTTLPPYVNNWNYDYNDNINNAALRADRVFSALDTSPPLFVPSGQQFLVGGGNFYVEVYLRRNLTLGFRPRWLLEANRGRPGRSWPPRDCSRWCRNPSCYWKSMHWCWQIAARSSHSSL